jgi:hypothetical protein
MEINSLLLYGLTVLHNLDCLCGVVCTLGVVALSVAFIIAGATGSYTGESLDNCKAVAKVTIKTFWFKVVVTILLLDAIFVPSYKEIIGIYIIPKVVNAELTQKIPDTVNIFLNKFIEEYDLKKK